MSQISEGQRKAFWACHAQGEKAMWLAYADGRMAVREVVASYGVSLLPSISFHEKKALRSAWHTIIGSERHCPQEEGQDLPLSQGVNTKQRDLFQAMLPEKVSDAPLTEEAVEALLTRGYRERLIQKEKGLALVEKYGIPIPKEIIRQADFEERTARQSYAEREVRLEKERCSALEKFREKEGVYPTEILDVPLNQWNNRQVIRGSHQKKRSHSHPDKCLKEQRRLVIEKPCD